LTPFERLSHRWLRYLPLSLILLEKILNIAKYVSRLFSSPILLDSRSPTVQLEEVLLISSALVNSSDKEATKQIEEEIEKVRKEGGLEESEAATETGEGGVGVEK